jgi:hypothetical protein
MADIPTRATCAFMGDQPKSSIRMRDIVASPLPLPLPPPPPTTLPPPPSLPPSLIRKPIANRRTSSSSPKPDDINDDIVRNVTSMGYDIGGYDMARIIRGNDDGDAAGRDVRCDVFSSSSSSSSSSSCSR